MEKRKKYLIICFMLLIMSIFTLLYIVNNYDLIKKKVTIKGEWIPYMIEIDDSKYSIDQYELISNDEPRITSIKIDNKVVFNYKTDYSSWDYDYKYDVDDNYINLGDYGNSIFYDKNKNGDYYLVYNTSGIFEYKIYFVKKDVVKDYAFKSTFISGQVFEQPYGSVGNVALDFNQFKAGDIIEYKLNSNFTIKVFVTNILDNKNYFQIYINDMFLLKDSIINADYLSFYLYNDILTYTIYGNDKMLYFYSLNDDYPIRFVSSNDGMAIDNIVTEDSGITISWTMVDEKGYIIKYGTNSNFSVCDTYLLRNSNIYDYTKIKKDTKYMYNNEKLSTYAYEINYLTLKDYIISSELVCN